jgi:2-dehydropantoate 2-reductase
MREIKRIAILGAGAIGSSFASMFSDAPGFVPLLIAKGDRLEKLNKNGIMVNKKSYTIPAIHPDKGDTPVDLIIVALKHHHLADAIHGLEKLMDNSTTIISVMNGLESEVYLSDIYGSDRVLYAVSVALDAVRKDNQTTYTQKGKLFLGQPDNTRLSQRVLRVQAAFDRAEIVYETPMDMIRIMWWKFMVNVGMNPSSALMGASYGIFQTSPDARGLMEALMVEVITIAEKMDINLTCQDIKDWYTFLANLSPKGKTSMLQDVEAGRKTEIEIFSGKVVELGKTHGIKTPVNQTLLQAIRVLEQGDRFSHFT